MFFFFLFPNRQGHIPKSFFKMQNTAGNGNCRAFHFAMTYACVKQVKDVDGSQQGVYAPIASLPHRMVLVYDPRKIIYLAMLHPSCFLLNPNALVCKHHLFPISQQDKYLSVFFFFLFPNSIFFCQYSSFSYIPKGLLICQFSYFSYFPIGKLLSKVFFCRFVFLRN